MSLIYLVAKKDGLLRYCAACGVVRTAWIGVEGDDVVVACCVCQRVHSRFVRGQEWA